MLKHADQPYILTTLALPLDAMPNYDFWGLFNQLVTDPLRKLLP